MMQENPVQSVPINVLIMVNYVVSYQDVVLLKIDFYQQVNFCLDCQGKQCFNGGVLNKNTCTCECKGFYKGDSCRESNSFLFASILFLKNEF